MSFDVESYVSWTKWTGWQKRMDQGKHGFIALTIGGNHTSGSARLCIII